ncbi:hypothetical protein Aduo_017354 [Ancylostoma duodenale]
MNFDRRPYKKLQCVCVGFIALLMLYHVFLLCAAYFNVVRTETCSPDPAGAGPCMMGLCPTPTMVCITGDLCCEASQVVPDPTVPPATTAPPPTAAPPATAGPTIAPTLQPGTGASSATLAPANCVDLLNPSTGISDCPAQASLCQNSLYYNLMTQQCPRTCGRCSTTGTNSTTGACADKLNPKTGTSDCPSMASYCNDATYYSLMTDQCPRTCGRCSTSSTNSTNATTANTCVDKINARTGVSDCPNMASYCNDSRYYALMTDQCPKTCGRCSSTSSSSSTSTACVDKINPTTNVSDCPGMASYCRVAGYVTLMQQQCPKTCGYCTSG